MPPLPADFIHLGSYKPICKKIFDTTAAEKEQHFAQNEYDEGFVVHLTKMLDACKLSVDLSQQGK